MKVTNHYSILQACQRLVTRCLEMMVAHYLAMLMSKKMASRVCSYGWRRRWWFTNFQCAVDMPPWLNILSTRVQELDSQSRWRKVWRTKVGAQAAYSTMITGIAGCAEGLGVKKHSGWKWLDRFCLDFNWCDLLPSKVHAGPKSDQIWYLLGWIMCYSHPATTLADFHVKARAALAVWTLVVTSWYWPRWLSLNMMIL